jgi:hypothetical protein
MKKINFTLSFLLVSVFLIGSLVFFNGNVGAQPKTPGIGKGPESGMPPGHGHPQKGEKTYHHGTMSSSMETKLAKQILGKSVISQDKQNLGTLHDLAIFGKGMVHYGILALEGQKDKYVAIPFNALESADETDDLVLQMKYLKVIGAPSFSLEEITDWDNSEIGEKVHSYFGLEMMQDRPKFPYGEKAVPGTGKLPEPGVRKYE